MFSRTKNKESSTSNTIAASVTKKTIPSVISSDANILGNIVSDGHVDIDGSVEGNVKGEHVTLRANGKVTGDITGHTVNIYGTHRGLIRAQNVHLYTSCRVEGVIMYETLTVEDGAFVDGKFKRQSAAAQALMPSTTDGESDDSDSFGESFLAQNKLRLVG